jgi:methionyl-tRNA formyltransferase
MSAQPLKIIFAGTPEFAAESLKALLQGTDEVIAVYTQPDRPAGRGHKLKPSPVKEVALDADIPVYQPLSLKDEEAQAELAALDADLMVVAAYGLILPKVVLNTPKHGCINVHASILPRWRGAAPIHRALLAGDQQTGITIMQMDVGLDTGDMLAKAYTDILDSDTSASLHDKLAQQGGDILRTAIEQLKEGTLTPEPQDDNLANYAHKLTKEEGKIDWTDSATNIARKVRGLFPWPSAYTFMDEQNIRIHSASVSNNVDIDTSATAGSVISSDKQGIYVATGEGVVCLEKLQLPGKKAMTAEQILNGNKDLFADQKTFA